MRRSRLPTVARQLLAEIPDADLLERYVQHRADDAFALLVTRYSRLVWGQCRNLLPGDADADDAFQATFLTLARSAKSIRPGAPLGPWLHGVAYRVCGNARRAMGRRAKREKACASPEADRPVADSTWEAAFAAVSEEVQKLPEAQRTAFVLCCIEGRATTEAAASLGQKLGTFSARLTRAKQTLLDRLARRGLGAPILALGGITGAVAVAPAALIERTLALVPSGVIVPSSVLSLTQGVTGMMMLRFKLLAAGVMVATGLGLSLGGGWSGEATAQVAATPATKPAPPKGDATIEKIRFDLERAKADLERAKALLAEAEARDRDMTMQLRLSRDLPPKFEYEPVPKEGLTDFEERLAQREKAGWSFVGQVTIKGFGPEEKLVFRKLPAPPKAAGFNPSVAFLAGTKPPKPPEVPQPAVRPGGLRPPQPTEPTTPVDPNGSGFGLPVKPPMAPGSPPGIGAGFAPGAAPIAPIAPNRRDDLPPSFAPTGIEGGSPTVPIPFEDNAAPYKARIAQLEKLLVEFQAGKAPVKPSLGKCYYRSEDFGNWQLPQLIDVLDKVFADEIQAKKFNAYFRIESEKGTFTVNEATPDEIRSVTAWLKKLKK